MVIAIIKMKKIKLVLVHTPILYVELNLWLKWYYQLLFSLLDRNTLGTIK